MADNIPIPYVNFPAQYAEERDIILDRIDQVFKRGDFIGGGAVEVLEKRLAAFCGVRHAVALNSGTDALMLAMIGLGIGRGDEVITPPNSFIASTASIVHVGATPVFADVLPDQNIDPEAVERAVTPRTKAIMAVHLTGRIADMDRLRAVAARHGLKLIEDAAQSVGSRYGDRMSGSLGDVGCFSAHPLKNLNAAGDGGFLTTDDDALAERVRLLRNHGLKDRNTAVVFGYVSRMDTLQAALLDMRLDRLPDLIARRRANAAAYRERLDPAHVFIPPCRPVEFNTFHTFVIQVDRRDELQARLAARGVATAVHYPVPLHLQPAAAGLGYGRGAFPVAESQAARILSLPIHQFLSTADVERTADEVNAFFRD